MGVQETITEVIKKNDSDIYVEWRILVLQKMVFEKKTKRTTTNVLEIKPTSDYEDSWHHNRGRWG